MPGTVRAVLLCYCGGSVVSFLLCRLFFRDTQLFLTPLVLGRLVQGIKPTQQVLTQSLGLGSLIPVFRLGAVERLAPGATGFHFLHGVEAVFQRGQVAARPLLLLDRREPAAHEIGAAEHVAATGASTQASPVAAVRHAQTRSAPKRNAS